MRYLPYLVGGLIALVLLNQTWSEPLANAMLLFLVALALLAFIALTISMALPRNVRLTPSDPQGQDEDLQHWLSQFESIGFERSGPTYRVDMKPAATMIALIHREHPCYATVYRTGSAPAKVGCDIVSMLKPAGTLTTTPIRAGTSLPAAKGCFLQYINTPVAAVMLQAHLDGLAWLQRRGIATGPSSATAFEADFRAAINQMRDGFLAQPLSYAATALFRTLTGLTPHRGPITRQTAAQTMARRLGKRR